MGLITSKQVFETEDEAEAFAADYRQRMWGYDGSAWPRQITDGDKTLWVVECSRYSSCD